MHLSKPTLQKPIFHIFDRLHFQYTPFFHSWLIIPEMIIHRYLFNIEIIPCEISEQFFIN